MGGGSHRPPRHRHVQHRCARRQPSPAPAGAFHHISFTTTSRFCCTSWCPFPRCCLLASPSAEEQQRHRKRHNQCSAQAVRAQIPPRHRKLFSAYLGTPPQFFCRSSLPWRASPSPHFGMTTPPNVSEQLKPPAPSSAPTDPKVNIVYQSTSISYACRPNLTVLPPSPSPPQAPTPTTSMARLSSTTGPSFPATSLTAALPLPCLRGRPLRVP
jgi:hypothetical protein